MPRPAARRRIARHLFTLLAAVSLVLCVAVCVLWVRSRWIGDRVERRWQRETPAMFEDQRVVLLCGQGGIHVVWSRNVVTGSNTAARRAGMLVNGETERLAEVTSRTRGFVMPNR